VPIVKNQKKRTMFFLPKILQRRPSDPLKRQKNMRNARSFVIIVRVAGVTWLVEPTVQKGQLIGFWSRKLGTELSVHIRTHATNRCKTKNGGKMNNFFSKEDSLWLVSHGGKIAFKGSRAR
jgi:hypothetical protein